MFFVISNPYRPAGIYISGSSILINSAIQWINKINDRGVGFKIHFQTNGIIRIFSLMSLLVHLNNILQTLR